MDLPTLFMFFLWLGLPQLVQQPLAKFVRWVYNECTACCAESSDYETVYLPADEYATVMHEINTNLSAENRSKKVVTKAIGDYYYSFENNGFDSYRIFRKKPIDE